MSEIKRYDVLTEPGGDFGYAQEDEEGIWVEYDHHESALAQALAQARAEMKERCALRVDSAGYPGLAQNIRSIDEGE